MSNPPSTNSPTPSTSTTNSPKAVDYGSAQPSSFSRFILRIATIENLFATVRTLAWVAPLTILIWVYAEREQVATREVTIPISVHSIDPSRPVRLLMSGQGVTARLVGPRAQVDQVVEIISRPSDEPGVHVELDRSYTPGKQYPLYLAQILSDNAVFKQHGVIVQDPNPKQVEVFVDETIEREVDVRVPTNVTNASALFEPARVKVRGPRAVLSNPMGGRLEVYADISGRDELRTPGTHEIISVAVKSSVDEPTVTVVPAMVKATLEVNQSNVSYQIPSIPVWPSTPAGLLDQYKVELGPTQDTLPNVTVIGPPEKIEAIKKTTTRVIARLDITSADVGKAMQRRKVKYDLPDGVTISKEDMDKEVSFRLVDRAPPGG